jgi:hypothetical protein
MPENKELGLKDLTLKAATCNTNNIIISGTLEYDVLENRNGLRTYLLVYSLC